MEDHESALLIEYDDISMKSKFFRNPFGGTFCVLKFDEITFFNTIYGFAPYWDYKSHHTYTSETIINSCERDKIHLKCGDFVGSIVN